MDTLEGLDNAMRSFRPQDLETASIRSAAPSYVSEVPSYRTTVSNSESIPPYSPPANNTAPNNSTSLSAAAADGPTPAGGHRLHNLPTLLPSNTAHIYTPGLPPIPPAPRRATSDLPSIGSFGIPSWSAVNTNPLYHRVATRRAQAAMSSSSEGLLRNAARVLERVNEEGSGSGTSTPLAGADVVRPLEDPYLVGEVAAARARRERLARENGDNVLQREDKRWDWFLAQQVDEERERSWRHFRSSMGSSGGLTRGRLARRFATGGR
ncbi:unnamed protein product [Discula destructiva]